MALFPAVLIGGPPDSGKSVLAARLTQALRQQGIQHYVLRACPDGEGDWTYWADQALVRTILVPRAWTPSFVAHVCRDLERRHLPLIVDVGGRPQPWQEAIFDRCTHAILLTGDDASRAAWLDRVARHGLLLLADLRSDLRGQTRLAQAHPVLRGTLAGLDRSRLHAAAGHPPGDPLFDALVERLGRLFDYQAGALRQAHHEAAPVETVVDLDRLARALGVPRRGQQPRWQPQHLPAALDYLPEGVPLALYGRGPNWLYAALALLAHPAALWQFDVRLGWVLPAPLRTGTPVPGSPLLVSARPTGEGTWLECSLPGAYIDYLAARDLVVPAVPLERGAILSGKLPHWLWTGLALAYRQTAWLAAYQPQLGGAVVVHSQSAALPPGTLLARDGAP